MPLIDHFRPPRSLLRPWSSFHSRWAVALCDSLNARLPADRFFADVTLNVGPHVEADVAEFELHGEACLGNGLATWEAPPPVRTTTLVFTDSIEVQVFDQRAGKELVGAIELVSPANKDRPEHRQAFTAKCAAYLTRGIGVVVVDVVTGRHANLHRELMVRMGEDGRADLPDDCHLYAVAYHPARREEANLLDLWPQPLELDESLPVLPLGLRGLFFVPIDLEAAYSEARSRLHL